MFLLLPAYFLRAEGSAAILGCTVPISSAGAAAEVPAFAPSAMEFPIANRSQLTEEGNLQVHSIPGPEKNMDSLLEMLLNQTTVSF